MKTIASILLGMLLAFFLGFTFSGQGSPFADGDAITSANMNEIDDELNALGSGKQPVDSDLTSIAALTTTSFGRGLLDDADSTAGRVTLGVVIGTNVQAYDADLAAVAALTTTATGLSLLDDASTSAMRNTMGVAIGTDVQAFDADLSDLADGTLSGSKIGSGIPDASNASSMTRDSEWDDVTKIEAATGVDIMDSTELMTVTWSASAASGNCTANTAIWIKTSATATIYACTATNTWTAL